MYLFYAYFVISVAAAVAERWLHSRPECVVRKATYAILSQCMTIAVLLVLVKLIAYVSKLVPPGPY